jgi:hypothetical protein
MGFFVRKAIRLGPVRFNLAKSGVGASIGVRGLRVGQDARGRGYVFGGRGGLYFRERLGRSARPTVGCLVALVVGLLILVALTLR